MTTKLCPCGQEFTQTKRNQWYCPACREAREQAVIASRTVACRHCHEVKLCKNRICPECREADWQRRIEETKRKDEAKLARYNAKGGCKCGELATHPEDGLCDKCHVERQRQLQREMKERSRVAYEEYRRSQRATQPQAQDSDESLSSLYERLDEDQQIAFADALVEVFAKVLGKAASGEEVNPEMIDADNQSDVDSAFYSLMDGVL